MAYEKLALPEVVLFTPRVFGDARGFFFESFNEREFLEATGLNNCHFVQDNHNERGISPLHHLNIIYK